MSSFFRKLGRKTQPAIHYIHWLSTWMQLTSSEQYHVNDWLLELGQRYRKIKFPLQIYGEHQLYLVSETQCPAVVHLLYQEAFGRWVLQRKTENRNDFDGPCIYYKVPLYSLEIPLCWHTDVFSHSIINPQLFCKRWQFWLLYCIPFLSSLPQPWSSLHTPFRMWKRSANSLCSFCYSSSLL